MCGFFSLEHTVSPLSHCCDYPKLSSTVYTSRPLFLSWTGSPCYTVLWYPYLFFIALIIIMAVITSFIQWLPLPGIGIGSVLFIASPTPRTWHVIDTYYIFAKWMDEWSQPNMSSHTFIPKLFSMITNDLLVAKSTGYFLISISTQ